MRESFESNLGESYQFLGNREVIRVRDKIYSDGSKIVARRGRKDNPQEKTYQEKIRILNDRRIVQRNYGKRLNNLIN
jgi:hypothetical protein